MRILPSGCFTKQISDDLPERCGVASSLGIDGIDHQSARGKIIGIVHTAQPDQGHFGKADTHDFEKFESRHSRHVEI